MGSSTKKDCWSTRKQEIYIKNFVMKLSEIFYSIEDYFIVQMIVKGEEVPERTIMERFRMDLKTTRERIATLNKDCLISVRHTFQSDQEGKKKKEVVYSINYKKFFNVAQYKFNWIADSLKKNEIESVAIPLFKCLNEEYCQKTFTELEALELFDENDETFTCTYCKCLVIENETDLSPNSTVARFNEEMEEAFVLANKITENIQ